MTFDTKHICLHILSPIYYYYNFFVFTCVLSDFLTLLTFHSLLSSHTHWIFFKYLERSGTVFYDGCIPEIPLESVSSVTFICYCTCEDLLFGTQRSCRNYRLYRLPQVNMLTSIVSYRKNSCHVFFLSMPVFVRHFLWEVLIFHFILKPD